MLYAAIFVIILLVGSWLHFNAKNPKWASYGTAMCTGGWAGVAVTFGARMLKLLPP